jgi:hypothetical protein
LSFFFGSSFFFGWELVSSNVYHNHDIGQDVLILFFKKPVQDDVLTTPTPHPFGQSLR